MTQTHSTTSPDQPEAVGPGVCLAPADFPSDRTYFVHGDREDEQLLAQILALTASSAEFAGYTEDLSASLSANPEAVGVICASNWSEVISRMPPLDQARVYLFPLPIRDFWSYWEFYKIIKDSFDTDNGIRISGPEWKAFTDKKFAAGKLRDVMGIRKALWDRGFNLASKPSRLFGRLPRIEPIGPFERQMKLTGEYWGSPLEPRGAFEEHIGQIDQVRRSLGDQPSQDAYMKQFFQYPPLTWEHYLNRVFASAQYFEYCPIDPGDVVLNCGVYQGWELPAFWGLMRGEGEIHNIDPYGYDFLSDYAKAQLPNFQDMTYMHRIALADYAGELDILMFNSVADDHGDVVTTNCVSLDELVDTSGIERVDVIKTDLEGAEEIALRGMKETVQRHRPKLAISIYHQASHFWELPLELIEMCKDYDFYFNFYSWWYPEGIFYAIPKEKNARRDEARICLSS